MDYINQLWFSNLGLAWLDTKICHAKTFLPKAWQFYNKTWLSGLFLDSNQTSAK